MGQLIQQKIGTLITLQVRHKKIDRLHLEWYELPKRILRKKTEAGKDISLKFLNGDTKLTQDDVIYEDETSVIAVDVIPCDALIVRPKSMREMASICYEIGNRHLPLFFEEENLAVPHEAPLFRVLVSSGVDVQRRSIKLLHPIQTSVSPHPHGSGPSLFSKIMELTKSENE